MTRKLPSGSTEATLGGLTVVVREKDGYINATRLCKDGGKLFGHWKQLENSSAFLDALSADIGIPTSGLLWISKGGDPSEQGTWVHPDVAVQIANWISPEFAVKVSQIVRRYYSGDLGLAAETVKNYDAVHGTTSKVTVQTVLGKRKAELEVDHLAIQNRRMEADMLKECMEFLAPADNASEIERIRAESDIATVRAHYVKVVTGGAALPQLTDGRGSEISFALMEQKTGVRLNKSQRQRAGKRMAELMRARYGPEYETPKREEYVDGRVIQVNAYWSRDEDLMREALASVV